MAKIYLEKGNYAIREIEEQDLPQLLAWRNSPEIHSKMLTDHIITWEEHLEWFNRIRKRSPVVNFAFTYNDELAGYTGCSQYDEQNKTCNPGCYLRPDVNYPIDAGLYISEFFKEYAFMTLGITKMITEVFADNKRVVRLDKISGYKIIGEKEITKDNKNKKVYIMSLDYEDWKKQAAL